MRNMTHIVAILKLPQILRKMLPADMDMSAVNPALQLRPEAFDGVDASAARLCIFFGSVIDCYVPITVKRQILVTAKFVGVDSRAGQDVSIDKSVHGRLRAARYNAGNQLAIAFQHADNARLVALVTAAHAGHGTANQRFVNLDFGTDSAKRIVAIKLRHILADFMAHAPRRFVSYAKLAFNCLGSNTVPRRCEQKHDKKPVLQWGASALKWRSRHRGNLVAAELA